MEFSHFVSSLKISSSVTTNTWEPFHIPCLEAFRHGQRTTLCKMIAWKYSLAYLDFFSLLFNEQIFSKKIKNMQIRNIKQWLFFFLLLNFRSPSLQTWWVKVVCKYSPQHRACGWRCHLSSKACFYLLRDEFVWKKHTLALKFWFVYRPVWPLSFER